MAITVSAIVLFGIISVVLWRTGRTSLTAGVCVFLFGFFTASSGAAPIINDMLTTLANLGN